MAMKTLPLHASDAVSVAAYDAVLLILRITFKTKDGFEGDTYEYFDVPADVVEELVAAESHGQFVNWKIKPRYRFEQVTWG
jgi:hypothetical protein